MKKEKRSKKLKICSGCGRKHFGPQVICVLCIAANRREGVVPHA